MALKTAKHSLLLDEDKNILQNRITDKSDQNIYRFKGQPLSNKDDRESVLTYIESLFENDNKDFDSVKFSKTKYKIKKWIESEKTPEPEKQLFNKLFLAIERHQEKTVNLSKTLTVFNSFKHKIKRFNDKQNAITDLVNLHNERAFKNIDQGSQLNIRLIEVLFKVPEHNQQPITAEVQEDILQSYFSQKFPNFELFLTVIHNDEIIPHVHGFINGKNKQSNVCDFVERQYQFIKSKKWLFDYPDKYSACSPQQVKKVGEWLQQDFYEFTNQYLIDRGHTVEFAIKELTREEQKLREVIKTNNAKRIADREYNTANYLVKENHNHYQTKAELELEISTLESKLKQLKRHIKSAIEYALEFAKSALPYNLVKYHQHQEKVFSIDQTVALKIQKQASDLQPTQEQKDQINQFQINRTKNKPND